WLVAEIEGGPKHGFDVFKTEAEGFWNENHVVETRVWDDKMYFLPISQSEIDKNPRLTQNALW
ncbi:MAG TPA: RagB/SusD family nutrient uptake outer membrane protein, partial [Bacteroidales bacterium]|nr:RagB/SusD family nutrient uptake outer membrane protein [Bacteroidales bacterium]